MSIFGRSFWESRPMTRNPYSPVCEERGATRVCSDSETTFAVVFREQGEEILAEVHDESLGGWACCSPLPSSMAWGRK